MFLSYVWKQNFVFGVFTLKIKVKDYINGSLLDAPDAKNCKKFINK